MLLFVAVAVVLLRRQQGSPLPKPKEIEGPHFPIAVPAAVPAARGAYGAAPAFDRSSILGFIKDEMFVLEQGKIAGELSDAEYKEAHDALEVVLKRVLQGH